MSRPIRTVALAFTAASVVVVAALAQTNGQPERFIANAINMNRGASGNVEIVVNRWSTDSQRDTLMSTLMSKGPDKLLDKLQDMPRMGFIRTPDSIGWDIHFARRTPQPEGGERVVLVTDRRIGFWEAANQPRSIDYPFTVIELRLNKDGEGEGKMSIATKIIADKENNIVTLENYETSPVMLTNVKRERTSQ
ncbi:MAG TPA: hypothetical protein VIW45_01455 [Vicinamibacterales bacterium]|jgi:hypothetical protein